MIRNLAGQTAKALVLNASTGAGFAGAVNVYITIDNGVQTLAGAATAKGNGEFTYAPSAAETNGELVTFTFVGTGAVTTSIQYPTITEAQQAALIGQSVMGAVSVLDLCAAAARELNILMSGETLNANDGAVIVGKLNNLLDLWNAMKQAVFSVSWETFTLEPGVSPHTLGPAGATWTMPMRPQTLDGAAYIYESGSTPVYVPISVHDANWWEGIRTPGIATSVQTDVAYVPTWPNGSLYFYPVPTTAAQVQLYFRGVLSQVVLTDVITLPPGYRAALELTLAEHIARSFGRTVDDDLKGQARQARATIFGNNDVMPGYSTADSGMPGYSSHGWTWLSGPRW